MRVRPLGNDLILPHTLNNRSGFPSTGYKMSFKRVFESEVKSNDSSKPFGYVFYVLYFCRIEETSESQSGRKLNVFVEILAFKTWTLRTE